MKNTITFSREALDKLKSKYEEASNNNHTCFVWKNSLMNVGRAKQLITKLEASPNLSISCGNASNNYSI